MKTAMYFAYAVGTISIFAGIFFCFVGHPEYLFINAIAGGACYFAATMCKGHLK